MAEEAPSEAPPAPGGAPKAAAQPHKVFIGGLSWETTDDKLASYFSNYGEVTEAFVRCVCRRSGARGARARRK